MPDPVETNEVDMASKIQILTRAMGISSVDVVNSTTGIINRQHGSIDTIIEDYKKLYAALTATESE